MAKFQIPLNGSNIVSEDRQQAFKKALGDDHQIDCGDGPQLKISEDDRSEHVIVDREKHQTQPANQTDLGSALDHTFQHQSRTMEIHQQYLSQQKDYLQLITAVLDQQGKVLDTVNGTSGSEIINTFQRTLDNFHTLREQSLQVHQEFLTRQAEFSDRYLSALEGGDHQINQVTRSTAQDPGKTRASQWVVQEPPIVLDDKKPDLPHVDSASQRSELMNRTGDQGISAEKLSAALLEIVADKTGYPAEMLELEMDLEADLGIDSIKRVEILGSLEEKFPSLPPADTEILSQTRTLQEIVDYMNSESGAAKQVSSPQVDNPSESKQESAPDQGQAYPKESSGAKITVAELTSILLDIVADKTGYPVEMLEAEMDMEADLGIDSIKRVEILGAMEERVPGLPQTEAEDLAELRTLGQIVELMNTKQTPAAEKSPVVSEVKKKADRLKLENDPVKLVNLPAPDQLEFKISKDRPVIVTDEGTALTNEIVKALSADGWKVVLWNFPADLIKQVKRKLPGSVNSVHQDRLGKNAIDQVMDSLREEHGSPAGFIHLHPLSEANGLFSERENQLIKQVFLISGSIKPDLNQLDPDSRQIFLTVTRTDGALGFTSDSPFQEGSGLTGLVKSLNWEWPDVFCRTVDINQDLDVKDASDLLVKEIHDPDQGLLEVGVNTNSRVTLERGTGSSI